MPHAPRSDTSAPENRRPQKLGRAGESHVVSLLERAGYAILDRNWRDGHREIDIVARWGQEVVFIEVKTRRPGPQPPEEAMAPVQRRRVRRAAAAWIAAHPGVGERFRFDVIVLTAAEDRVEIFHFQEAFDGTEG
jgi:putative endonuclease